MASTNGASPPVPLRYIGDLKGGIVAAFISLPMSMSMGIVAFAPFGPDLAVHGGVAGIYSAVIVGVCAAVFGGRVLMVPSPRAAAAVIFASLAVHVMASDSLMFPSGTTVTHTIAIAFLAAFLAGVIQAGLGFSDYGSIVKYIPQPVVAGFVNSSALLIVLSQLNVLLDLPRPHVLLDPVADPGLIHPLTMVPGFVAMATVLAIGRWAKRLPASFIGLLIGSAAFYLMKASLGGVDVGTTMGELTSRLPAPAFVGFIAAPFAGGNPWIVLTLLIPAAVSMAAVGSMETSLSIATIDRLTGQRTDHNRELRAQGIANAAAAALGALFASGGIIRTKPAYDMGGRSVVSAVVCGLGLMAATIAFPEMNELIHPAVGAGVLNGLGFENLDRGSLQTLRRSLAPKALHRNTSLIDTVIVIAVILTALAFDLIVAVIVGIFLALLVFVARMGRAFVRRVGKGPAIHSRSAWDEHNRKIVEKYGHRIAVVELEGALFLATADTLDDLVRGLMAEGVTHVVLDMKRISQIDTSGAVKLADLAALLAGTDGRLVLGYVPEERRRGRARRRAERTEDDRRHHSYSREMWRTLEETGVVAAVGGDSLFPDTNSALVACERDIIARVLHEQQVSAPVSHPLPSIVDGLAPADIRFLRRQCRRDYFDAGETIFEQGDRGDALFLLSRGRADVTIYIAELGQEKRLQTLLGGAVFGEMALLDDKPRAASVRAVDPSVCYRLDRGAFELIKRDRPVLALKLFNNLCIMFSERMRSANTMISELEK